MRPPAPVVRAPTSGRGRAAGPRAVRAAAAVGVARAVGVRAVGVARVARAAAVVVVATGLACLAVVGLTGCGGAAADLFAVTRSGTVPGADFKMIVRDDGSVTCDGRREVLPSDLVINARGISDALQSPASAATALPSGPRPVFTYFVLTPAGRVSFSDSSPRQPQVFYQLGLLTTQVARRVCRLPR